MVKGEIKSSHDLIFSDEGFTDFLVLAEALKHVKTELEGRRVVDLRNERLRWILGGRITSHVTRAT